jgi:Brain and reproductive organ-expressed protein (BRE)
MPTSNITNGEQITINLPFAGTKLSVELMFHSEASNIPPDFVWLSDDFPQDPEAYGRIASAWNPSDKCCLRNYLAELVKTYKMYQVIVATVSFYLWFYKFCFTELGDAVKQFRQH